MERQRETFIVHRFHSNAGVQNNENEESIKLREIKRETNNRHKLFDSNTHFILSVHCG